MKSLEDLFNVFPPHEKEEWIRQLEKDLKGKSWTELAWDVEEEIRIDPFYYPGDRASLRAPLEFGRDARRWEIGEIIEVEDVRAANGIARQAIAGGVNSPGFLLLRKPGAADLAALLEGIDAASVCLNFGEFYPDKDPLQLLHLLLDWCNSKGIEPAKIKGSIDFDPFLDWNEPPLDDLAAAIRICAEQAPNFKVLQVNGRYYHAGPADTSNELALMIAKGAEYVSRMAEMGISPAQTHHFIQFSVALSKSYFVEIAKLRALRLLWNNVLAGFGLQDPEPLEIIAHLAKETQDENMYTNIIRAGTQAMSAVIGGANRLYILPANAALKEAPTEFTRRIARNIHHLLDLESHLGQVTDPAAGSYYIEQLTDQLAEKAWEKFQEYDRAGEFR